MSDEKRVWFLANHYCTYSNNEGGTGPYEGYTTTSMQTDFKSAWLEKPHEHFFIDSIVPKEEISGECVHLVVVRYSDGSSFGDTSGYYRVVAAFNDYSTASTWRHVNYNKYQKKYDSYFGSLESLDVETVRIECAR